MERTCDILGEVKEPYRSGITPFHTSLTITQCTKSVHVSAQKFLTKTVIIGLPQNEYNNLQRHAITGIYINTSLNAVLHRLNLPYFFE